MTKMLVRIFGHVTAVDVSKEMIDRARVNLADLHNVTLMLGDGATLSAVPDESQDFAFSFIVFQHILTDVETRVDGDDVTDILRPRSFHAVSARCSQETRSTIHDSSRSLRFAFLALPIAGAFF